MADKGDVNMGTADVMLWNIHDEVEEAIKFSDMDDYTRDQLGYVRNVVLDIIRSR